MRLVVLSDFDGTIVDVEMSDFILSKFAEGDWKIFDEQLERGEITLEECVQRQFAMVRVPEAVIIKELDKVASFRPNFGKLVDYCSARKIPLVVVSGGLDFVIRHFLELKGWSESVEVYAGEARYTNGSIKFDFPKLLDRRSANFKDDLVRRYRGKDRAVAYIGDGISDYQAAKNADLSFVVKGSKLARYCRREGIPHMEFVDFQEVVDTLKVLALKRVDRIKDPTRTSFS